MEDQIVDNAPEMDLTDPAAFEALVAGAKAPKADEPTGEKETKDVSPTPEPADDAEDIVEDKPEDTEESPEKLKARIRGLQAELTRRKGNAEKVGELELKLAKMQGELEQVNKAATSESLESLVGKLDDTALISKQTDWEDELADARARYAAAEERGNDEALAKQGQRITYAKRVLSAIRKESLDRVDRKQRDVEVQREVGSKVKAELDSMYEAVNENFPELADQSSDLWKAGNEEFNSHPILMKQLGATGEIVAAALAIIKNPELVGQRTQASARRDVVSKLEKGIKKALSVGASSPTTGRTTIPQVTTGEGLSKFNEMVDRIKGG